ncbi:unnamed protein product [Amoebophrya sp. A120]|nr:unnamed protein product [Amoebophrya sp. A120]|eukprot:GSA120T00007099001.1
MIKTLSMLAMNDRESIVNKRLFVFLHDSRCTRGAHPSSQSFNMADSRVVFWCRRNKESHRGDNFAPNTFGHKLLLKKKNKENVATEKKLPLLSGKKMQLAAGAAAAVGALGVGGGAVLTSRISELDQRISTLQSTLEGKMASVLNEKISALESTLDKKISDLVESTLEKKLSALESRPGASKGNALENPATSIDEKIRVAVDAKTSELQSRVSELETGANEPKRHGNLISVAVNGKINPLETVIHQLVNNEDTIFETMNRLESKLQEGKINVLQGKINTLEGKMPELEGKIPELEGQITALESTLDGKISEMKSTLEKKITEVEGNVPAALQQTLVGLIQQQQAE